MAQMVIGFFKSHTDAQHAADELIADGFERNEVDVASPETDYENAADINEDRESGLKRFFKSLFGEGDDAERYRNVSRGCAMVTVQAQTAEAAERAADVLDACGAMDIDERNDDDSYKSSGEGRGYDTTAQAYKDDYKKSKAGKYKNAPLYSQAGENKRKHSQIVERTRSEEEYNHREQLRDEQNPIDSTSEQRLELFKEGTIELTERKEVPVVNREARIVEEVKISKEMEEKETIVKEKVRNTEIDIDKVPADEYKSRAGSGSNEKRNAAALGRGLDLRVEKEKDGNDRDDNSSRNGDPLFGV